MLAAMDLYCERAGPEFWAEPVNALTNLAFIAAGLWGVREARRRSTGRMVEFLAWWVVAIGIGSGLFHTFANRLTMFADVLPIAIFTILYTGFAIHRYLGFGRMAAAIIVVAFFGTSGLLAAYLPQELVEASNGSTGYLPAFLALIVFGAAAALAGHPAGRWLVVAACVFVVSVTARALDMQLCSGGEALGTHFLWHLLNALVLGLLLAAAVRHGRNDQLVLPEPIEKRSSLR